MKRVRIGNGCGFWGDNIDAGVLLAEKGRLDYLTLEYLAELTMSILALQKQRDPRAGFATDFLDVPFEELNRPVADGRTTVWQSAAALFSAIGRQADAVIRQGVLRWVEMATPIRGCPSGTCSGGVTSMTGRRLGFRPCLSSTVT